MKEEELKELVEKRGYLFLGVKRFKTHDRVAVITPSRNTLRLTLRKHIEDMPLDWAKEWFP